MDAFFCARDLLQFHATPDDDGYAACPTCGYTRTDGFNQVEPNAYVCIHCGERITGAPGTPIVCPRGTPTLLPCGHEVLHAGLPHYCTYIGLHALLALVRPFGAQNGHIPFRHYEERQFIVVHQTCELLFDLMLDEIHHAVDAIHHGRYALASSFIERCTGQLRVVNEVVRLFEAMTPESFAVFRTYLRPASGLESLNFRKIEVLSGLRHDSTYMRIPLPGGKTQPVHYRDWLDRPPGSGRRDPRTRLWTAELTALTAQPSLQQEFQDAMAREGYRTVADIFDEYTRSDTAAKKAREDGAATPAFVMREEGGQLYALAMALYEYDRMMQAHRSVHISIVKRLIGGAAGTGGTGGISYLESVRDTVQFFPEIWALAREKSGPAWKA